jgi:hypothetical protein
MSLADQVMEALQRAWNEHVAQDDTYPPCFAISGTAGNPRLSADFRYPGFAGQVAAHLELIQARDLADGAR